MSTAQETARGLRAAVPQLPKSVVGSLDDDLTAIIELLAVTLRSSSHADEILVLVTQAKNELCQQLARSLGQAETAIKEVADGIAVGEPPAAGPTSPPPVSRKVTELRGRPRDRHPDKDLEQVCRAYEEAGWAVEKRSNHFWFWGPDGSTDSVGTTPNSNSARAMRRKLEIWKRRKNRPTT